MSISTKEVLQVKTCSKCGEVKEVVEFYKVTKHKDGLAYYCKCCVNEIKDKWIKENRTKDRAKSKRWRDNNKEQVTAKAALYYQSNKDVYSKRHKEWCRNNRGKRNHSHRKYEVTKMRRTPSWANLNTIQTIYQQASHLTLTTGIQHHVDHIIPLQGKTVSGLHVEYNLQILTATENLKKSNKLLGEYL